MTRREFGKLLIKIGLCGLGGAFWLFQKTNIKKFLKAKPVLNYPGKVIQLKEVEENAEWLG